MDDDFDEVSAFPFPLVNTMWPQHRMCDEYVARLSFCFLLIIM